MCFKIESATISCLKPDSNAFSLQVVFFMYLWSIDIEAVVVSMSCFHLLCEESEIRCSSDEFSVQCLLPNYQIYQDLSNASTVLATGSLSITFLLHLFSV